MAWRLFVCLVFAAAGLPAQAHEVRPAYLGIAWSAGDIYAVTWKQPAMAQARIALDPVLPAVCTPLGEMRIEPAPAALIKRWRVRCRAPLEGQMISVAGLERTLTSVFVRIEFEDRRAASGVLSAAEPALRIGAPRPSLPAYLSLGVEHILKGVDHVFFVIGLVLLVPGLWRLVKVLTAFTIAHSLTLGAAALGAATLPQKPVEAVIALSIMVVGYEAVRVARGQTGLTGRWPWLVALGFGLLHGFGFAGALSQVGLPQQGKLEALLLFNLGVEGGQLLIVAVLVPIVMWVRAHSPAVRLRFELGSGYVLGSAAAFWLIERVAAAGGGGS